MRTLLRESQLKYLSEETKGYVKRLLRDYQEVFTPFGPEERKVWWRWIGKGNRYSDDLADIVADREKKMVFRARALVILLSPVWTSTRSIPWKWRSDINIHGETRTIIGAEDYLNSRGKFPLSLGDDTLIDIALAYMDYFRRGQYLYLIEGAIINYNDFLRSILSILPVDHPLAEKVFNQYRWFDLKLSPPGNTWNHTPGYHQLSPLNWLLKDPRVSDIWKVRADRMVWGCLHTREDLKETTIWRDYCSMLQSQSYRHFDEGYSLRILVQQWRQVQTIDPSFGGGVDQVYSLLRVFSNDEETRHFGRELFQKRISSKDEAFHWLDIMVNRSHAFGMVLNFVFFVRDVVEKFGGEDDPYAVRFIGWYKEWQVSREGKKKKQKDGEIKNIAQQQALNVGLNQ